MRPIRILHVSDLHFGIDDPKGESARIASAIINCAREHYQDFPPDICIATGDVAQSAEESQYTQATEWFSNLLDGWEDTRLFVVPGNHDIARPTNDRHVVNLEQVRSFQSKERKRFPSAPDDLQPFSTNLESFRKWHEGELKACQGLNVLSSWKDDIRGCTGRFDLKTESEGFPPYSQNVAIVGLNSAALSFNDRDKNNLLVDIGYLNKALHETAPAEEVVIVAMHHPVAPGKRKTNRWLAEWNNSEVERCLLQSIGPQIFMHGHLHKSGAESRSMFNGQHLTTISAGAAYQHSKYPITFGCHELRTLQNQIDTATYAWDRDGGNWRQDARQSDTINAVLPNPLGREEARALSVSIRALAPRVRTGNSVIDDVIANHSKAFCGYLESIAESHIVVDTHILYQQIIEAMSYTQCEKSTEITIQILDQDVNRWNELIDREDQIGYNTFNYSEDILGETKAVARLFDNYRVRRVFVLGPPDADPEALERIHSIFSAIDENLYRNESREMEKKLRDRIQNRYVVANDEPGLSESIAEVGDIVVVTRGYDGQRESTLFSEKLSFKSRKRATETEASVSAKPEHIDEVTGIFNQVWDRAHPIREFGRGGLG